MAEGLSVGGLASGLDTNSIISGLVAIENQRVTRQLQKQKDYELKLSTFNELKTKLDDFYAKSKAMDKVTSFDLFKGITSDGDVATISGEAGGTAGNFDLKVTQLASTLKVASKTFTSPTDARNLTGSFKLSVSAAALKADPTVTDVTIDLSASDTLKDIAAKINKAAGGGAKASIVQMGTSDYRLMLTAVDEGTKAFSLSAVSGDENLSIFSDGLDLVNEGNTAILPNKSLRTNFDLRLAAGGPAVAGSKLSELFNGIGADKALDAGDAITITGTDAQGNAVNRTFTFTNPATEDVQDLLDEITTGFGGAAAVDVSVVSGEIVVTDKTDGATVMAMTLTFVPDGDGDSTLNLGAAVSRTDFKNVISQGQNAFFLMNDISVSSQTNKDNKTVAGTIFELKRVDTTQTVKLQLEYDKDAIKKQVQGFLDSYNLVLKFLDDKSKVIVDEKADPNQSPLDAAKAKATIKKGPFAGDSSIQGLRTTLQGLVTNKIDELDGLSDFTSLASLGITSDRKSGLLTIDDDQFKEALDTDFEGVKRLFVTNGYSDNAAHSFGTFSKDTKAGKYFISPGAGPGAGTIDTDKSSNTSMVAAVLSGENDIMNSDSGDSKGLAVKAAFGSGDGTLTFVRGVAGQIKDYYEKITDFVDGFVTQTSKNIKKRIDDEKDRITILETRVAAFKVRLTQRFANLELSIAKLQQQSASFNNQISSFRR